MRAYLVLFALLLSTAGLAQTKVIAFKSHSGSMHNFEAALVNPEMDLLFHNLGEGPQPIIRNSVLDSVIFVSDSQAVMVTTTHCSVNEYYNGRDQVKKKDLEEIWHEGKDTVLNHPLFSHQHSLDSIRNVLDRRYYFRNDAKKIVFIGFDNGPEKPMMDEDKDGILDNEDEEILPITDTPSSPFGGFGLIMMSLVLASVLIGLMSWMVSRRTANSVSV